MRVAGRALAVFFVLTFSYLVNRADAQTTPNEPSTRVRAASFAWMSCLADAATALARQPEPVATIVKGAYGNCVEKESVLRSLAKAEGDTVYADAMVDQMARKMDDVVTSRVLSLRAN